MSLLLSLATALTLAAAAAPALPAGPDFGSVQVQPYTPPKAAPSLALPDLSGKTVRLEDFKGKVVMLVFWATW